MAGRKRRGTRGKARSAAQRAQLKRAQQISARKRRRRNVKAGLRVAGGIVGAAVVSAGTYHVNQAARNPVKTYKSVKGGVQKIRGSRATKSATPVGAGLHRTTRHGGHRAYLLG